MNVFILTRFIKLTMNVFILTRCHCGANSRETPVVLLDIHRVGQSHTHTYTYGVCTVIFGRENIWLSP